MPGATPQSTVTRWNRWWRFSGVGALGVGVQLAVLALCVDVLHVDWRVAVPLAVAAAVVHNFVWHQRWTWADRRPSPSPGSTVCAVCRRQRTGVGGGQRARHVSGGDVDGRPRRGGQSARDSAVQPGELCRIGCGRIRGAASRSGGPHGAGLPRQEADCRVLSRSTTCSSSVVATFWNRTANPIPCPRTQSCRQTPAGDCRGESSQWFLRRRRASPATR